MKRIKLLVSVMALGGVVAACDSEDSTTGINTLGAVFVRAFNAAPNAAPLNVTTADLQIFPRRDPFDVGP